MELIRNIELKLKALRFNNNPLNYISDFLFALLFPKSTIDKFRTNAEQSSASIDEYVINKKLIFKFVTNHNLLDELNSLIVKKGAKSSLQFIIIFNNSANIIYSYESKEHIISAHSDIFKFIEILLPLAGIPLPKTKFINKDVSVAEIIGELFNELRLINKGEEELLQIYTLQIMTLSIVNSFDISAKQSIAKYYKYISDKSNEVISKLNFELLQYANGSSNQNSLPTFIGNIPIIKLNYFETVKHINLNKKAISLINNLINVDWIDVNSCLLYTSEAETVSVEGTPRSI